MELLPDTTASGVTGLTRQHNFLRDGAAVLSVSVFQLTLLPHVSAEPYGTAADLLGLRLPFTVTVKVRVMVRIRLRFRFRDRIRLRFRVRVRIRVRIIMLGGLGLAT